MTSTQIAARAGSSVAALLTLYSYCIHGREDGWTKVVLHPGQAG